MENLKYLIMLICFGAAVFFLTTWYIQTRKRRRK